MKTRTAEKLILNLTRVIRAPRQRVFAAFSSMDEIKKWLGPDECRVTGGTMDFRKGGKYNFKTSTSNFGVVDLTGAYQEIVPNELVRFTWAWKNNPVLETWGEMTLTVRFTDHKDGTQINLTHEGLINEEVREGHNHGWSGSFDKLDARFEPSEVGSRK